MDEQEFKNLAARNIVAYRKQAGFTQLELAEKLNYSDKAVSKWERGEALPDMFVLKQLADILSVTLNDLISEREPKRIKRGASIEKRVLIPISSVFLIFLIATLTFGIMLMLPSRPPRIWMCFVYALPASAICLTVFSAIWGKRQLTAVFVSAIVWSTAVLLYLLFDNPNNFVFFVIAAPGQVITILGFLLFRKEKYPQNLEEKDNP